MKLDKIGPNTLKVVPTPTTTTEKNLKQIASSSHQQDIQQTLTTYSLTIHYLDSDC